MKRYIYLIILVLIFLQICEVYSNYPGKNWYKYKTPEEAGWSSVKLKEVQKLYKQMNASAVMVIYDGNVLLSYGDVNRRFLIHSIRKSLISALYGIYVAEKKIDINKTLEELGIDDRDTLTKTEKKAKISDLLKARSGIYIPSANETEGMRKYRPKRGSHKPGEFWCYNNWDFNVLGAILEKETRKSVFDDIYKYLAEPLQMEDYRVWDGFYNFDEQGSKYPAYLLKMSARDLARFGLLYLRDGKWNSKVIIKDSWIKESIYPYSVINNSDNFSGYGFLWWLSKPFNEFGAYCASGLGGQFLYIIPKENLVFVFRSDTFEEKFIRDSVRLKFMNIIIKSKTRNPKPNPKLLTLRVSRLPGAKLKLNQSDMKQFEGKYIFKIGKDSTHAEVKIINDNLIMKNNLIGNTLLLPQTKMKFIMEDVGWNMEFIKEKGKRRDSVYITFKQGQKLIKIPGKFIN